MRAPSHEDSQVLNYRYEAIIDYMLANPQMTRQEIAETLGYTQAWFSTLTHSDAFLARYEERRLEFAGELKEKTARKIYDVANAAAERVLERLEGDECPGNFALDAMTGSLRSLGFGAPTGRGGVQVNTQVNVPQSAYTAEDKSNLAAARARLERVSQMEREESARSAVVGADREPLPSSEGS